MDNHKTKKNPAITLQYTYKMKAIFSMACIFSLFALNFGMTVMDSDDGGEFIETPPPWALTTQPKEEKIIEVGCFNDKFGDRALPILVKNYRLIKIDWSNMASIVNGCGDAAKRMGFKWFSVQFYGECWSGPNASTTYNKHGPTTRCWNGVGVQLTNMVYKIE